MDGTRKISSDKIPDPAPAGEAGSGNLGNFMKKKRFRQTLQASASPHTPDHEFSKDISEVSNYQWENLAWKKSLAQVSRFPELPLIRQGRICLDNLL